jgi:1-acyl-sn-glycerol-3-phosphate acyltransferase
MKQTNHFIRAIRVARLLLHLVKGVGEVALLFPRRDAHGKAAAINQWSKHLCHILSIRIDVRGCPPDALHLSNTILVANHISWLDIFVMNAVTTSRFVAKSEVRRWPVLGWLCEKTGTLFITRERRHDTRRVNHQIAAALASGNCIAVFPEGGTTDGRDVARFNASLLQPAIESGASVQAIALRYLSHDGRQSDAAAYIGEMSLADSLNRLLAEHTLIAELTYLPKVDANGHDRRELAELAHSRIRSVVCGADQDHSVVNGCSDGT